MSRPTKYKCGKCGSLNVCVKLSGKRAGLYCADCGAWIEWLSYSNTKHAYKYLRDSGLIPENAAIKQVGKFQGSMIVYCSECKCQLSHSSAPRPTGQFDLIDAKFCPKCGKEFV